MEKREEANPLVLELRDREDAQELRMSLQSLQMGEKRGKKMDFIHSRRRKNRKQRFCTSGRLADIKGGTERRHLLPYPHLEGKGKIGGDHCSCHLLDFFAKRKKRRNGLQSVRAVVVIVWEKRRTNKKDE